MPDRAGLTDTHLHLWDLSGGYGWLAGAPEGLRRDVRWEDVVPQLAAVGVRRVVLVQADDTRADTLAMQAAAERIEAGTIPGGSGGVERVDIVAWLPLDDPHEVAQLLDDPAAMHRVVGVRHLVHDDPDPGFLDRPTVRRSLQLLAARGLPLDVPDAYPRHLQQATRVAREVPDLTVVLDHLAKPPFGDAAAMREWEEQLREAAEVPTVVAKASGLSTSGRRGEALEHRREIGVGTAGGDPLVEREIGRDQLLDRGVFGDVDHQLLEDGEVLLAEVRAGLLHRDRLQQPAHLEDLPLGRALVEIEHEGEGLDQQLGGERGDVGAVALPDVQHPDHGQRLDRLAQGVPADPHALRELLLGRESMPGAELADEDHLLDGVDRPIGHRMRRGHRRRPPWGAAGCARGARRAAGHPPRA